MSERSYHGATSRSYRDHALVPTLSVVNVLCIQNKRKPRAIAYRVLVEPGRQCSPNDICTSFSSAIIYTQCLNNSNNPVSATSNMQH